MARRVSRRPPLFPRAAGGSSGRRPLRPRGKTPYSLRGVQGERRLALGLAAGVDRGEGHVVEALRAPRSDVENTRHLGVVEKMQVDLDDVLDRDEVASLLAVPVPPRPDEGA